MLRTAQNRAFAALVTCALILTLTASVQAHDAQTSAKSHRCKDVTLRDGDGNVFLQTSGLTQKRTTCKTARKVVRRFYLNTTDPNATGDIHPYGYSCDSGDDGGFCKKGKKRITWGFLSD